LVRATTRASSEKSRRVSGVTAHRHAIVIGAYKI